MMKRNYIKPMSSVYRIESERPFLTASKPAKIKMEDTKIEVEDYVPIENTVTFD